MRKFYQSVTARCLPVKLIMKLSFSRQTSHPESHFSFEKVKICFFLSAAVRAIFLRKSFLRSTSLFGGNQVDGVPPVSTSKKSGVSDNR